MHHKLMQFWSEIGKGPGNDEKTLNFQVVIGIGFGKDWETKYQKKFSNI